MPVPTLDGVCCVYTYGFITACRDYANHGNVIAAANLYTVAESASINIGLVLRPHLMFGETAPTWKRC